MNRALNVIAATLLLLAGSLPLFFAAVLVFCAMGRPILFVHMRPGLHGRPFRLLKLRTMTNETDGQGRLLPPERRVSRAGKFLRATSLDELPQLWNVVRGDMNLVGPRPLLMEYLDRYTPEQRRRHDVRPGITGWAQVNGRNALDWEERFRLDVWYVDHRSLLLDLRILWLTLLRVLHREDVNFSGGALSNPYRPRETVDGPGNNSKDAAG